jgi:hypothetical protein
MPYKVKNTPYLYIPGGFLESERRERGIDNSFITNKIPIDKSNYHLFPCIQVIKGFKRVTFIDEQRSDYSVFPLNIMSFINDGEIDINLPYEYFEYIFNQEYIFKVPRVLKQSFLSNITESPEAINPIELTINFLSIGATENILNNIKSSYRINLVFTITNQLKPEEIEFLNNINSEQLFYSISYLIANKFLLEYSIIFTNYSEFISNSSTNCSFRIDYINYHQSKYKNNYSYRKIYYCFDTKCFIDSYGKKLFDFNKDYNLEELFYYFETGVYTVSKTDLDICKDCEFRHMCVDNRLPYKRSEKEWYHKIECNYNPYIAKWEGEEGYQTLAECGVISNDKGCSIDHDKIAEINQQLWSEE